MHAPLMYSRPADKKYARTHLMTFQHGLCAGCFEADSWTLHIDHDHVTGLIRGLLCPSCNLSEEGGRTIHWQGYVDSPPAAEMQAGRASALPTFITRIKAAEERAEWLARDVASWQQSFEWLSHMRVKEMMNDGRYRDHPTIRAIQDDWNALDLKLRPAIEDAVTIDREKMTALGAREYVISSIISHAVGQVLAPMEAEIRDKHTMVFRDEMAARTVPHQYVAPDIPDTASFNERMAWSRDCTFAECGIEQSVHPRWTLPDRTRIDRLAIKRRALETLLAETSAKAA